jgi:hypothetical protein
MLKIEFTHHFINKKIVMSELVVLAFPLSNTEGMRSVPDLRKLFGLAALTQGDLENPQKIFVCLLSGPPIDMSTRRLCVRKNLALIREVPGQPPKIFDAPAVWVYFEGNFLSGQEIPDQIIDPLHARIGDLLKRAQPEGEDAEIDTDGDGSYSAIIPETPSTTGWFLALREQSSL